MEAECLSGRTARGAGTFVVAQLKLTLSVMTRAERCPDLCGHETTEFWPARDSAKPRVRPNSLRVAPSCCLNSPLGPRRSTTGVCVRIPVEMNRGAKHDMTITIRLSDEEQRRLAEGAARNGRDVAEYVHSLIERDIQEPSAVDQALAPFRREVEASGMTDDELGDFFEEVREEVWQEKHGGSGTTS